MSLFLPCTTASNAAISRALSKIGLEARGSARRTASIPEFPVTNTVEGLTPSDMRLSLLLSVGEKCSVAKRLVALRLNSSGNGACPGMRVRHRVQVRCTANERMIPAYPLSATLLLYGLEGFACKRPKGQLQRPRLYHLLRCGSVVKVQRLGLRSKAGP